MRCICSPRKSELRSLSSLAKWSNAAAQFPAKVLPASTAQPHSLSRPTLNQFLKCKRGMDRSIHPFFFATTFSPNYGPDNLSQNAKTDQSSAHTLTVLQ